MNSKITIIVLTFILSFLKNDIIAQTISFGLGPVHTYTNHTTPLVNGTNYLHYAYVQKWFGFSTKISNKIDINIAIANYDIRTLMPVDIYSGQGFTGATITRFDVGISYNLLKEHNRFYVKPSIAMGLQFAKKTADLWREQFRVYGPDYYQTRLPDSKGASNFQIVPVGGFSMGVKFLKRCEAGIVIQGIYGYKTFQTLYFYYNHKDSPTIERTAVFESRGTGINSAIFLGVNIGKKSKLNESNNHAR